MCRAEREVYELDESDSDDEKVGTEDRAREEAMHACKLGTRCPLVFMALHRSSLHHTPASTNGIRPLGAIRGRVALNVWNLPEVYVKELPSLKSLPLELLRLSHR